MTSPLGSIGQPCRFKSCYPHHVGASFVSLAPTYFISQSTLTPPPLLSNCAPLHWARSWRAARRAASLCPQATYRLRRAFSFHCKAHRALILLLISAQVPPALRAVGSETRLWSQSLPTATRCAGLAVGAPPSGRRFSIQNSSDHLSFPARCKRPIACAELFPFMAKLTGHGGVLSESTPLFLSFPGTGHHWV